MAYQKSNWALVIHSPSQDDCFSVGTGENRSSQIVIKAGVLEIGTDYNREGPSHAPARLRGEEEWRAEADGVRKYFKTKHAIKQPLSSCISPRKMPTLSFA